MIFHANPPQTGSDKTYVHNQDVAASTWVITHNLGKYPSVRIQDSSGNEWEGDIVYNNLNQLSITFSAGGVAASFGGSAYLN